MQEEYTNIAWIWKDLVLDSPVLCAQQSSLRKRGTPHDRKRDLGLSLRMMDTHKSLVAGRTPLRVLRELADITASLGSFSWKGKTECGP